MIIAVLGADILYRYDTSKRYNEQEIALHLQPMARENMPLSTQQVLGLCLAQKIETLWIMPGCETSKQAKENPDAFTTPPDGWGMSVPSRNQGAVMSMKLWQKNGPEKTRRVVFTQHSYRWELGKVEDPMELLHTLVQMHVKLGQPIELTPGGTGRALMASSCEQAWLKEADLSPVPRVKAQVTTYKRPFTEQEKQITGYLHIFDKNGDYLAACTGVELGVGSPYHLDAKDFPPGLYRERQAGLWRLSVVGGPIPYRDGWYWTPTVHRMIRRGAVVEFHEAWLWKEHHPVLKPWAYRLWDVISTLTRGSLAREMSKRFYTQGLGWLSLPEDKSHYRKSQPDVTEGKSFDRWDWHESVIAHSQMVIDMKLLGFEQKGITHIWQNRDEIGFITPDPDPTTAVPGLSLSQGLGGFKSKFGIGIPVTDALIAAFAQDVPFAKTQTQIAVLAKQAKQRTTEKLQRVILEQAITGKIAEVERHER